MGFFFKIINMTQIELFLDLANPNESGKSRRIFAKEFIGKYSRLRSGNGYKWPEGIPYTFVRGGRGDNWFIELTGNKSKVDQRPIRKDIREVIGTQKCAHTGFGGNSSNKMVVDHKNGRYNDSRVLDKKTQSINDFQALCNQANLQKRTHCGNCIKTGIRFDAKTLGYTKSVSSGSLEYNGSCEGCYWFDPIDFRQKM
jgi:hypothetical protein